MQKIIKGHKKSTIRAGLGNQANEALNKSSSLRGRFEKPAPGRDISDLSLHPYFHLNQENKWAFHLQSEKYPSNVPLFSTSSLYKLESNSIVW